MEVVATVLDLLLIAACAFAWRETKHSKWLYAKLTERNQQLELARQRRATVESENEALRKQRLELRVSLDEKDAILLDTGKCIERLTLDYQSERRRNQAYVEAHANQTTLIEGLREQLKKRKVRKKKVTA